MNQSENKAEDKFASINNNELLNFLKHFFLFGNLIALFRCSQILREDFQNAEYLWPLAWLRYFKTTHQETILITILFSLIPLAILVYLNPKIRLFRIISAFNLFLLGAAINSFGAVSNDFLGWSLCPLFICLCKSSETAFWQKMNTNLIWAASSIFLLFYFLAGLYKTVDFYKAWSAGETIWNIGANFIPNVIEFQKLETQRYFTMPEFLIKPNLITFSLCILAISFELASVLPIFLPILFRPWSVLIIFFHAFNLFCLSLGFSSAVYLSILMLFLSPIKSNFFKIKLSSIKKYFFNIQFYFR